MRPNPIVRIVVAVTLAVVLAGVTITMLAAGVSGIIQFFTKAIGF